MTEVKFLAWRRAGTAHVTIVHRWHYLSWEYSVQHNTVGAAIGRPQGLQCSKTKITKRGGQRRSKKNSLAGCKILVGTSEDIRVAIFTHVQNPSLCGVKPKLDDNVRFEPKVW